MIFYFTGTGNSLYVAKQLGDEIISIPQIISENELTFCAERIGIVCPIYGHEMPAMVKEFVKRAVFETDYFYVVLTYGAFHGGASEVAEQYLKSVGKKAAYITTIEMVDNFLPNFDVKEQCQIDKKVEEHLQGICRDIEMKKHEIQKVKARDRVVHKMYTSMVKNQPETIWADYTITRECVGCGICMKVCPAGCIRIIDQKAVHETKECQACMACIHACPKTAVRLNIKEVNPNARYRNEHVSLAELIAANNQT